MKYFSNFPKIDYSDNVATNILVRAKIRDLILQNNVIYYEYDLDDWERPDILALKYYGSVDHTWILFYANEILDPIYDWLLSYEDFNNYLLSKYEGSDPKDAFKYLGEIQHVYTSGTNVIYEERITPLKATDQIISPEEQIRNVITVISRTEVTIDLPFNNDLSDVVCIVRNKFHSYYNEEGLRIDYNSWNNTPASERNEKTYFQYESEQNENKRRIKVIDRLYYEQIVTEFERIFR